MEFHTQIPIFPLNQFVESFFYYKMLNESSMLDRFLPDGNVQLIFDLSDETKYIYDNESLEIRQSCSKAWFSGFRTGPITIPSGINSEMLIVNFHKGMARSFLSDPLHALTDHVVDAEIVFSKEILSIRDALLELMTPAKKISYLENYLLSKFQNKLDCNPCVQFAIQQIINCRGDQKLSSLTDKVGYSHKHFIKLFKDHLGVTPKRFLKIIQFQSAIEAYESGSFTNWTDIAYHCGYFDQSHFIADFKSLAACTPKIYAEQKGQFVNYIPVEAAR